MSTEDIERELAVAQEELAVAERRAGKPRIRAQAWDVDNLPRVDLGEVLNAFDPVSVGNEQGHEYIVVAPKGSVYEDPEVRTPTRTFASHAEVAAYQMAMRDFGLPSETGPKRIGIGTSTGQQRVHDRVNFVQQIGVGEGEVGLELGTAVASPWTAWTRREYNNDLVGYKGLRIYDKMRKSDGTVRGTLRLAKTPVLAGQWGIKPASDSVRDKNIANFVWNNLTQWMSMSWPQFVVESLLMLDFGYYMFEKVFAKGEDVTADPTARGKIVWKKFAPRHPMDVKEWFMDLNGGPLSVDMWAPPVQTADTTTSGGVGATAFGNTIPSTWEGGTIQAFQRWINIPIDKLLVFTFDKEAGNIEGISLLRSAYKHWYYKDNLYKIDAIQKERHGIGVPIIQLPMGYDDQDKGLADQLGRNLRTNERAHVVLPPNWVMSFAELKGQPVDCLKSISHHDDMIPQSIIGRFMNSEKTDIEEQHTLFLKATRFTADIVLDTLNKYAIPQLVNMNWGRTVYPQLYVKRIGEQEDWRTNSFTLRNYVGAGVIVPDDDLEDAVRDEMGLPPRDDATARVVRSAAQENPQKIQPAPTELPGAGHKVDPTQVPGQPPVPYQTGQLNPNGRPAQSPQLPGNLTPPKLPRVGPPRQGPPGASVPGTGKGDRSGTSGRRGQ
jgi:hypothetical protein